MRGKESSGNGRTFTGEVFLYSSFFVFEFLPKFVISVNQELGMPLNQHTCPAHVASGLFCRQTSKMGTENYLIRWISFRLYSAHSLLIHLLRRYFKRWKYRDLFNQSFSPSLLLR